YGGDEFAIIAPETGIDELEMLAGRLVDGVRETPLVDWDGSTIPLSISVGGAVMLSADSVKVDGLLAAADASLYQAKQSGKGRCGVIAGFGTAVPATS
ncbi:MAG: GGDEF domain-containing protein, partial [Coriobacteriia bacterium]|nr:GGDEF domain-containing protein [Coriobacteriia bacterium]